MVFCRGFTVLQAMLVMAIIFLLLWQAMPGWRAPTRQQQALQLANRFMVLMQRAKSEALLRQQPVHVCAANLKLNRDLQGCLASPRRNGSWHVWEEGVLAFIDKPTGRPARYDSKEAMLQLPLEQAVMHVSERQFAVQANGRLANLIRLSVRHADGSCWQWRLISALRLEEETCST